VRSWNYMQEERDVEGKLTSLALALDAISGEGCDCGEDEPGTCLGHRCETAIHEQFDEIEKLRLENNNLRRAVLVRSLSTDGLLDDSLDRLRAENADLRRQLDDWRSGRCTYAVHALPRRQSAHAFIVDDDSASKGEAQRIVYVWATMESEAIDIATRSIEATDASRANELRKTWTGYTKHAVTLTATKVKP
jgi:hypothetical protein